MLWWNYLCVCLSHSIVWFLRAGTVLCLFSGMLLSLNKCLQRMKEGKKGRREEGKHSCLLSPELTILSTKDIKSVWNVFFLKKWFYYIIYIFLFDDFVMTCFDRFSVTLKKNIYIYMREYGYTLTIFLILHEFLTMISVGLWPVP